MSYIMTEYDEALRKILKYGVKKENRTGVDTIGYFGIMSRYNISENFPLLTKRKVWPKAIFAELLWFLSGSTNNKDLQSLGSNIWTPWVSKDFETKNHYAEGSFGPVYGFQLRHFGGKYGNGTGTYEPVYSLQNKEFGGQEQVYQGQKKIAEYGAGGFDQLQNMVNTLKTDPNSRRNLFSLWNPSQLDKMRLPPCHYSFQVYVHDNKLSGLLTQRSCDFPIGVPANIQFYSALIYMLAQQTDLEPYEFVHSTVDSHIYVDQIDAVEEYLSRNEIDSPKLRLNKAKSILDYSLGDFSIEDYHPDAPIKIPVAV